jgi:hypothetical protein
MHSTLDKLVPCPLHGDPGLAYELKRISSTPHARNYETEGMTPTRPVEGNPRADRKNTQTETEQVVYDQNRQAWLLVRA